MTGAVVVAALVLAAVFALMLGIVGARRDRAHRDRIRARRARYEAAKTAEQRAERAGARP